MTVFILAIVAASLWSEVVVSAAAKIFKVNRENLTFWMWIITALIFSILAYIIIRFIIKVPITAAFSFQRLY